MLIAMDGSGKDSWNVELEIQKDESGADHEVLSVKLVRGNDKIVLNYVGYYEIAELSESLARQIEELI